MTLRWLGILIICAATLSAPARVPFMDKARPTEVLTITAEVGGGTYTMRQDYAHDLTGLSRFDVEPGHQFSIGFSAVVPFRNYLGVGTGFHLANTNYEWRAQAVGEYMDAFSALHCDNWFTTIEIPVYLQLNLNPGSNLRWSSEAGAYMTYGIGGSSRLNVRAESISADGQTQIFETKVSHKYYDPYSPIFNGNCRTDLGLHLATGLTFHRHITAKAILRTGLRNTAVNYDNTKFSNYSLTFMLRLGYTFTTK